MFINTNKFRQPALTYQEIGKYTNDPPKTTGYREFWDTEIDRCLNGFYAEDGDYITGYHYFYLNYCPILLVKEKEVTLPSGAKKKVGYRERDFPRFWDSDYQFFRAVEDAEQNGRHLCVLKTRGRGYSYKAAAMLCRNYFLVEESKSYAVAAENEFLIKDGLLSKTWEMMSFVDDNTAWSKKRQKLDTKMHKRASMVIDRDGVKTEIGYQSEIIGITVKNDVQKIRGKRGKLMLFEEAGKFPNLKDAWNIALSSMQQGEVTYGLMLAFGTGGTKGADYEGLKELFYYPDGYNILPFDNIWDEGATKQCGLFIPEYMNLEGHMDEDGNSLVHSAKAYALGERKKVEENSNDKASIDRYIAEKPFTPAEATLQISSNIFPKKDLMVHMSHIMTNSKLYNYKQVGELFFDESGTVKWKQSAKSKDIVEFPLDKAHKKDGAIVIWEHPPDDIPYGLYVGGCLTPGEKILTGKGLLNVEDITLEDKLINKDGNEVGINTLIRYDKVNEPTYKVHMSNVDRPTIYTQEHPLYISDSIDGEYEFIRVRDVKEGSWTKYPNVYNKEKEIPLEKWDKYNQKRKNTDINPLLVEGFWWFVGHWLGDGFNHNYGNNYTIYNSFGKDEDEYLNKYKRIVTNIFNRKPNLKLQNGSNTHKFEYKQLYLFLEENFGKYASGKYISEWVKYIPNKYKLQLILGYLDADGSVYKDKGTIRCSFKSINKILINDIQDILFSLGVVSSFNFSDLAGTYNINGKSGLTKDSYCLRINQKELKKLADQYTGYSSSRKLRIAKEITFKQKPKKSTSCIMSEDNKYIYLKIKNIELSKYTGVVYNFDCETHSFISQYCSTHNCDPYDHDESTTTSLGSCFIYKRFQNFESYYDIIVAEYTGRPDTANEFYENVRLLLLYYRASLLYENQNKGLFQYFTTKHCEHLLADQPSIIDDIIKDSSVQRRKGIHMNNAIKEWAERETRDWLNEEYEPGKKNLTKILSIPLIQELISYNDKGNFDRVIALFMVMIYKKELHKVNVKKKDNANKKDPFFTTPLFKYYN